MKIKLYFLFSAAFILLALISCQEEVLNVDGNTLNIQAAVDPKLDSLQVEYTSASVQWHGMPVVGAPPAKAVAVVTLELHNTSSDWTLDSLIVLRASIMRYPEYVGAMKFPFDDVSRVDGSVWNARLEPNQRDTLWCSYRFERGIFHQGDSLVIRCEIVDQHGNSKYVDSFPIRYEEDL